MSYAGILKLRGFDQDDNKYGVWFCTKCGNIKRILVYDVLTGHTRTCGCLQKEIIGNNARKHGGAGTNEYAIWKDLRNRCYNKNNQYYHNYGGRGIYVSDEWRDNFEVFLKDMGPRPSKKHSVHRIDNDGPYSKDNCKWALIEEQARNKRTTCWVTYNNETKSLAEWAEKLNIPRKTLCNRIHKYGWTVEEAFETTEYQTGDRQDWDKIVTINGDSKTMREWIDQIGLTTQGFGQRLKQGWSIERALSEPINKQDKLYTYQGQSLRLAEWSRKLNINRTTISARIRRGLPMEEVFKQ